MQLLANMCAPVWTSGTLGPLVRMFYTGRLPSASQSSHFVGRSVDFSHIPDILLYLKLTVPGEQNGPILASCSE